MSFLNELEKKTVSQKKYRASKEEVDRVCTIIVKCLDAFNEIGEDDENFSPWDRKVDSIPVLSELKFYLKPASVRINPLDRKMKDLLWRKESNNSTEELMKEGISYTDYINALSAFRGFFKKEAFDDVVMLGAVRQHVALADILSNVSTSARAHYFTDNVQWPLRLKDDVVNSLLMDSYLNADVQEVEQDFLSNLNLA